MKAKALRSLQDDELAARVAELRDGLFNLKIKHATGQLENTTGLRVARRDLARALSIASERKEAK